MVVWVENILGIYALEETRIETTEKLNIYW